MNTSKVKDPPLFGFSQSAIKLSSKLTSKLQVIVKQVVDSVDIRTSTPKFKSKTIMDISFLKKNQNVTQIDNDSGYMSQNQESNSESVLDGSSENGQAVLSEIKAVYLSEDALLERPDVKSHSLDMIIGTDEKSFGSTERIEASVSTESEHFSALRDSGESGISDVSSSSVVIPKIKPIILTEKCTNFDKVCDISNDSNIENVLNISNNSKTSLSAYNISNKLGDEDKENLSFVSNTDLQNSSFEQNISVRSTNTTGPLSPELFSDEEGGEEKQNKVRHKHFVYKEKYILRQDQKLIKNVQGTLSGVLPPPSLTSIHLTAEQMLERIEANKYLFWAENCTSFPNNNKHVSSSCDAQDQSAEQKKSLLLTTRGQACTEKPFPQIMEDRYHGLHFNRSKLSEDFEMLCMKYAERYVGCETQSTCTVFQQALLSSPLKRKASRLRWAVKSPGRRLSHLARRRITFSSANLQASSGSGTGFNAHTRQVVMDSKRFQLLSRKRSPLKKSPKKTPKKSPRRSPRKKIRTPTSSAKKRLSQQIHSMCSQATFGESSVRASATKRALFQSPDKRTGSLSKPIFPSTSGTSSLSPFKKRMTPKCALFTSPTKSSMPRIDGKRKRTDSDDIQPSKLPRSMSLQDTGTTNTIKRELARARSEAHLPISHHSGELSDHHKKKLQWAVYETLRSQNIGINHPQFKQFASVLARVTRRFLPNLAANVPRPEGGTSDRMLRIARQHIQAVMKGKSVDEILLDFENSRLKNMKPNGYVGLGTVRNDPSATKNKENVLRDRLNTMSNEKSGLNRSELIKATLKAENPIDRARRMINFDDENNSDIR